MVQQLGILGDAEMKRKIPLEISVVFPAYNEVNGLEKAVLETRRFLEGITDSFEIIIAEDGSTDGTDILASALSKKYPNVKHLHSDIRLGRGRALKKAFRASKGRILVFMDVDLATDLRCLKPLIESVEEGYDFVTGSRMLRESIVERSFLRRLASTVYNLMVRLLLGSDLKDHQCGFKAFKRESLFKVIDKVKAEHWFWDTELLVLASRLGFKIKEIPVVWKGGRRSKVRLLSDTLKMGLQILRLWYCLNTRRIL